MRAIESVGKTLAVRVGSTDGEEVARLVSDLARAEAGYISGASLKIDGFAA